MDLFKIFGRIIIDNDEAIDALEETTDKAEEASESVDDFGSESKKSGKTTVDSLLPIPPKFAKVATAAGVVVTSVVALGKAIIEIADSTREYRLEMGKLEAAFISAGHTTEEATETYRTLYSVLGETDRAVETSQHIARLCSTEEEMKAMTEALIGVFASWDDSLPLEGLAEAANETAKTGILTGVLADALNWAGVQEGDFQKKLDACNTERERTKLILEKLNDLYSEAADIYKKNNKEVIAATEAQEKLNAATARWGEAAEPAATALKEVIADAIVFCANAFEYLMYDKAPNAIYETFASAEEAAAKIEELKGKIAELTGVPLTLWTSEHTKQKQELSRELEDAQKQYDQLTGVAQKTGEATADAVATTAESIAEFTSITEQYVADAMTLFETFGQTYENIYSKVSGFFDPFEKAKISVTTNVNDMMTAMQSQVDFNNAYTANLQALKEYGLGSLSEAFQSYGAEGAAYAAEIVKAVEQAGGATSEKGQQIIQGFTDINQSLTESQEGLSQTMALMDGEFEKQLQDMVDKYGIAIEDLDKSAEASTAATSTFEAFLEGMNQKLPSIMSEMQRFGQKITSSLQSGIGSVSIPVNIKTNGNIPGAKCGMDYVPYDEYLVYLHKGEAVLTKEEATAWRAGKEVASAENTGDSGGGGGGVTVNQYIEAVAQTPVELASATAAYFEQARWIT